MKTFKEGSNGCIAAGGQSNMPWISVRPPAHTLSRVLYEDLYTPTAMTENKTRKTRSL